MVTLLVCLSQASGHTGKLFYPDMEQYCLPSCEGFVTTTQKAALAVICHVLQAYGHTGE